MKLSRSRKDHIGIWFEERRKLGVSDKILLAYYSEQGDEVTHYTYRHGDADGISCLIHRLDSLGEGYNDIPLSRENSEPDKEKYREIKRDKRPYSKKVSWLYLDPLRDSEEECVYTVLLSQEKTALIKDLAKKEGVSLNILLFWSLNKACSEQLMNQDEKNRYSWLYPVGVRGAVNYGTPYSNYSSGFYLQLSKDTGLHELNNMVVERLKSGEHWINWQQAKLAKFIPRFLIRSIYRYISKRDFYAGSFSSLGEWNSVERKQDSSRNANKKGSGWWYLCAPGTANYPISNCCLVWNGKLSISLKLHQSISPYPDMTREVLCGWINSLLTTEIESDEVGVKIIRTIV